MKNKTKEIDFYGQFLKWTKINPNMSYNDSYDIHQDYTERIITITLRDNNKKI